MKKTVILSLLLIFSFTSIGLCSDTDINTKTVTTSTTKLLYPSFDYFFGMHVQIAGDDKIYSTNDPLIEKLLANIPKSKKNLDDYYFENTTGVIINISSIAALIASISYMGTHKRTESEAAIVVPIFYSAIAGCFIANWFINESYNAFYKSLNEYNLTISAENGTKAVVGKVIKF